MTFTRVKLIVKSKSRGKFYQGTAAASVSDTYLINVYGNIILDKPINVGARKTLIMIRHKNNLDRGEAFLAYLLSAGVVKSSGEGGKK